MFVLILSTGLEGYHVQVNGRHVASFPYRVGFILEDAAMLSVSGDVDIQSIVAGSLPMAHPSNVQRNLEFLTELKAPLPEKPIELFIGILSAGSHFTERMAVRISWMSSIVMIWLFRRLLPFVNMRSGPAKRTRPTPMVPGYIVSSDIANFVVSEMEKGRLKLFKMEDVSMGMWVGQFIATVKAVEYIHCLQFCQFGYVDDYLTAHYQSPGARADGLPLGQAGTREATVLQRMMTHSSGETCPKCGSNMGCQIGEQGHCLSVFLASLV
ncbi:hypothetical protein ABZP36_019187 [Zizania latifolia]